MGELRGFGDEQATSELWRTAPAVGNEQGEGMRMTRGTDRDAQDRLHEQLGRLAQAVGTARDLPSIFRAVRDFAIVATPSNGLFASLYDSTAQQRTCVYAWSDGLEIDVSTLPPLPMSDSPHSRAVSTGEVIVTDDLQVALVGQPRIDLTFDRDPRQPQSSLAVPMAVMGRVLGGFEVQSPDLAAYHDHHVSALRLAAHLAGTAIENVQLLERERQLRREAEASEQRFRFLSEAGRILAASLDEGTTRESIAQLVVPGLADWCVLDLIEDHATAGGPTVAAVDAAKVDIVHELRHHYPLDIRGTDPAAQALQTGRAHLLTTVSAVLIETMAQDAAQAGLLRALEPRSLLAVPLVVQGQTIGVLTLARTGTEQRYQAEDIPLVEELAQRAALGLDNVRLYAEAQAAIKVRDQFLSVAAHELKTPLTSLRMYTELLERRSTRDPTRSERDQRTITSILTQADRLHRLIDSLLDISRNQSGRLAIEHQAVDVATLTCQVVSGWQPLLTEHTLQLTTDESLVIEGDAVRLEQVLQNLLHNAIKYSPNGGLIEVEAVRRGDRACLVIKDHGIGIPTTAQTHLFQPFFRAANVDTSQISGFGIGLYVVHEIVKLHGGDITVQSGEGEGTTFTVCLPALLAASDGDCC